MKSLLIQIVLLGATLAFGAHANPWIDGSRTPAASFESAGDNPFKSSGKSVADFCVLVAEESKDVEQPEYVYAYRTLLYKAAGVDPVQDDKATVARKMSAWWPGHRNALRCNVLHSVVRDGSVLKLAVDRMSSEFLTDVARRWKLDMNQVDPDGTTVLDFVDAEIEITDSEGRKDVLRRFRSWIVLSGGKHSAELR